MTSKTTSPFLHQAWLETSVGLFVVDAEFSCLSANPAALALARYGLDELKGQSLLDILEIRDSAGNVEGAELLRQHLQDADLGSGCGVIRDSVGSLRQITFRAVPVANNMLLLEVSEQRANEQLSSDKVAENLSISAVRSRELRFCHLADGMPQLVWIASTDGVVEYYNARSVEYSGFERQADQSWTWEQVLHPDDMERSVAAWDAALATQQPYEIEHRIRMATGMYRWHLSRAFLFTEPSGVSGWFGTATDIHAMKLAEELQRSNAAASAYRLQLNEAIRPLANSVQIQLEAARLLGEHLKANRVFYAEISVDGSHVHVAADYHAGVASAVGYHRLDAFGPRLMRQIPSGQTLVITDVPSDTRLGPDERAATLGFNILAYVIVPILKEGRASAVLVAHQASPRSWSASEIARIEETAERTWEAVERARAEEARHLANVRLLEKDRLKSEYIAMLGHELRNPVAAVRNAVTVLHSRRDDSHALGILQRQIDALSVLVDDLVNVSRATNGRVSLRLARINLVEIVAHSVASAKAGLIGERQMLEAALPATAVWINGDAVRIEQILANLIENAATYSGPEGRIHVSIVVQDGIAKLQVKDDGIGLQEDEQTSIFELFVQGHRELDRSQGGLGVGLTMVKQLTTMHGGSVEARSEGPGRGSEFVVSLPVLVDAVNGQSEHPGSPDALPETKRILVVEDSEDIAETMKLLLEDLGHAVSIATDGPTALSKIDGFLPDVVLLDIGLPGMDGYEIARRLRQAPLGAKLVLAAITGYGQQSDKDRSMAAGFDAHFVKPINFDELENFINVAESR